MSQVLSLRAIAMLTTGTSTRAVARELNVHFSTISHLQCHFREIGSTSKWPHYSRPRLTTAQDLHNRLLHLRDRLRPAPGQLMKLRTISAYNKVLLWGKNNVDSPQWVGLALKWVGLCPPRTTHGYAPAQPREIHKLGPNEIMSIDWFPHVKFNSVNLWNCCMLGWYFSSE